jgi:hypothetical protein
MTLAQDFSSIFTTPQALAKLDSIASAGRLTFPTFNLTTTSLRYLPKWLERLHEISTGAIPSSPHGNYFSDPAALGLVEKTSSPPMLTSTGSAYLSLRDTISGSHEKSEYELVKLLYFQKQTHPHRVQRFLTKKRNHMLLVLTEFQRTPNRELFLRRPNLLVIAEYIANFPGVLKNFVNLPGETLSSLSDLGESGFQRLCSDARFSAGLNRLCQKIGSDYTRGEYRRLHYIVSMALLQILFTTPNNSQTLLTVPTPFSNLLTENDIYRLHSEYTDDFTVVFDGTDFAINTSLKVLPTPPPSSAIVNVSLQQRTGIPSGTGTASASSNIRKKKCSGKPRKSIYVIDPVMSERAEDFIEKTVLEPRYGASLRRVGHTTGETLSLSDGMVPGADFYVIDTSDNPIVFIEVKSIFSDPPVDVSLTRAEYLRACRCASQGISYRLILLNIITTRVFEDPNFATAISASSLDNLVQFVVNIGFQI